MSARTGLCPDWCVTDHSEHPLTETDNLITHQAMPHAFGMIVTRTDCPDEGTVGVPALRVALDLELATWEQAADLARSVLDAFGYLDGAAEK